MLFRFHCWVWNWVCGGFPFCLEPSCALRLCCLRRGSIRRADAHMHRWFLYHLKSKLQSVLISLMIAYFCVPCWYSRTKARPKILQILQAINITCFCVQSAQVLTIYFWQSTITNMFGWPSSKKIARPKGWGKKINSFPICLQSTIKNLARSVFHYRIEPGPWEVEFGQNQRNERTKANVMAHWFSLSSAISFGPLCSSLSGSYYCAKWNQREKQLTPLCQSQPPHPWPRIVIFQHAVHVQIKEEH